MKKYLALCAFIFGSFFPLFASQAPFFEEANKGIRQDTPSSIYVGSWSRYRINFGMEKIHIRFPNRPYVTQENGLMIGSSTDKQVLYKFVGYYPPMGNIDPHTFFKRELNLVSVPPYLLLGQGTYQLPNGDWVLDYVAHDTLSNLIIKHRSIITPFNAYTLRAIFPNGLTDRFDYFLESFRIQCESHD